MATQYSLMQPGSTANWPASSGSWETANLLRFKNPIAFDVPHRSEPLRESSLVQPSSNWQSPKATSQSNVIQISNFDAINPWNKIREEVSSWADLKADWDDEGAVVPRPDGLKFLDMMITRFKNEGSPKATPYIAGDGEFGLHWRLPGGRAILSILADGRVLAFCPRRSGDPIRVRTTLDKQIDMKAFYSALREIAQ